MPPVLRGNCMVKLADFMQKQMAFSAYVRNPEANPAPHDIEPRRMKIYADLFYNNIESLIGSGFPVLRRITSDAHWHRLIRSFYQHHKSKTPYFLKISEEFLAYLQGEHQPHADDPPFLWELAHYEWVELALSVLDKEEDFSNIDTDGNLCQGIPVLSNAAWSLAYQFPVHKISPQFLPDSPSAAPTFLIVYRDSADQVRFLEINQVTARLVQLLQDHLYHTLSLYSLFLLIDHLVNLQ